ncbi:MAG: DUF4398 domain-containing protein [Gammaproteobacteria bacterium]|nr:MAG: DUF4398 domain-containing protein [Gammaproteobacteria bacterium]
MDKKTLKTVSYMKLHLMIRMASVLVCSAIFLASCESIPAPTEQLATSRAAVDTALSAGSNELAPLQLKSAIDKLEAAERAMGDKNYVVARQLAEEAQIDAQLAEAMARTNKAQKAADALQESSRVLRQEIDRQIQ